MSGKSREEAKGTPEEALWDTPTHWPRNVRRLSISALGYFGEDPITREFFWDGQPFVLKRRFETFERVLAVVGLSIAGLGSLAAVVVAVVEVGRAAWGWS